MPSTAIIQAPYSIFETNLTKKDGNSGQIPNLELGRDMKFLRSNFGTKKEPS